MIKIEIPKKELYEIIITDLIHFVLIFSISKGIK